MLPTLLVAKRARTRAKAITASNGCLGVSGSIPFHLKFVLYLSWPQFRLMGDGKGKALFQHKVAYGCPLCVYAELPPDKSTNGVAKGEELKLGAGEGARQEWCHASKVEDAASRHVDASQINLSQ